MMTKLFISKRLFKNDEYSNFNVFTSSYLTSLKFAAIKLIESKTPDKLHAVATFTAKTKKELLEKIEDNKMSGFQTFETLDKAIEYFDNYVKDIK